jgi:2-polyprenyl-3-methyl-5-hydroxy-6-metoxy-1,4-benzoquinol methylase
MNAQDQVDRSEVDHYNRAYRAAADSPGSCRVSIGDLCKARKRVRQALVALKMPLDLSGKRVLDVGCGLGATAEAFREMGAGVTAVDVSLGAIEQCRTRFPQVDFRCLVFPSGLREEAAFDLIWLLDMPLVMSLDVEDLKQKFLRPSLPYLKPDGAFIIGTHSNFSGKLIHGWAHWSLATLWRAKAFWKASGPIIPQLRFVWLSILACHVCRLAHKSAPIFLVVKAAAIR